MQQIRIVSRKYDGRLRDEYEALLYAEDDERLVVYAPVGTMSYDRHKQAWVAAQVALYQQIKAMVATSHPATADQRQ